MTWFSILLWVLTNLPDLIALIRSFLKAKKQMSHETRESLRIELSRAIRSKDRATVRAIFTRTAAQA